MKWVTSAFFLLTAVWAYTIESGYLRVNNEEIALGEMMTQQIRQLALESPKDKIEVEVVLKEKTALPSQLVVAFLSIANPDYSVQKVAKFAEGRKIKAEWTAGKLPDVLKTGPVAVHLIVGLNEGTLYKQLGQLEPSTEFAATSLFNHQLKMGAQPEIHHQFRGDNATVNPIIPLVFIGGAVVLFLALLGAWVLGIGPNALFYQFKVVSGAQLMANIAFLSTLVGFEVNVAKYYLGQSIFTTLFYAFVLAGPSVYFGSKVLRFLKANRVAGRG